MKPLDKEDVVLCGILECAKQLFSKHGLKKTTMEEIAQAAGKGKSTLYYYFPSKNEIFQEVVEEEMKALVKKLREAINAAIVPKDKLKAFADTQISCLKDFHNLIQVVLDVIFSGNPVLNTIKHKYELTQLNMIREIIIGGIQSGDFKDMSDDLVLRYSYMILTAFRGFHFPLLAKPEGVQCFEDPSIMIELLVAGLGKK